MVKPGMNERCSSDRSSDAKYKGVRKRKWGKWVSEIRLPNSRERIWLGSYDTPEKAARAFDAALYCLRGNSAKFNFPEQPPNIPGGRSLPPSEIQAAAARFANQATPSQIASHPRDHCDNDNDNSNSSSSNNSSDQLQPESPSPSVSISDGAFDTTTSSFLDHFPDINLDTSSNINTTNVQDYGIFPGFDDYFMPPPPIISPRADYGEDNNSDGIFSQDPSFLWNF